MHSICARFVKSPDEVTLKKTKKTKNTKNCVVPADFVLEVEGNLVAGARLALGTQWKLTDESSASRADADAESLLRQSVEQQEEEGGGEDTTVDTSGM